MDKSILDACCGPKMFWFDKYDPHTVYCDKRRVQRYEYYPKRFLEVAPDVQCDFRQLPFRDETFWHIVFDPPHLRHVGEKSWTFIKYGALDSTWGDMLHDGFDECWRVLKTNGTLIFKWSSVQIPLSEVLQVIRHKPLYGNRSGKHMTTHWLAFVKFEDDERKEIDLFENRRKDVKEKTCGNCDWLEKDEGKPYYCAWHDLYDCHEEDDAACEDWRYREQEDEHDG